MTLINFSNAELHPICHLLALLGAHHILHVSRLGVEEWVSTRQFLRNLQSLNTVLWIVPVLNIIQIGQEYGIYGRGKF